MFYTVKTIRMKAVKVLTVVPYPEQKVVRGSRVIPANTSTHVYVDGSQCGVAYQLYSADSHMPVGKAVLSDKEGGTVQLPTGRISQSVSFYVIATKQLSAMQCSKLMKGKVTIHTEDIFKFNLNTEVADNAVMLSWFAKTPEGGERFEILRSVSDNEFSVIGMLKGKGVSSIAKEYKFIDRLACAGVNKYRVKQVNVEGIVMYSPIIEIELEEVNGSVEQTL